LQAGGGNGTITFRNTNPSEYQQNVFYWADTAGANGALSIQRKGWVNAESTNEGIGSITTSCEGQVVIEMGSYTDVDTHIGTSSIGTTTYIKGMEFTIKVIDALDELGGTLSLRGTNTTFTSIGLNIIYSTITLTGVGYIVATGNGKLRIDKNGYVGTLTKLSVNALDYYQQKVAYGYGSGVDIEGGKLQFGFKVASGDVMDELGYSLTPVATDTVKLFRDADGTQECNYINESPKYYNNAWYIAATGTVYAQYWKDGYVITMDGASMDYSTTTQKRPNFATSTQDALKYAVKIGSTSVQTELGEMLTLTNADIVKLHTQSTGASEIGYIAGPRWGTATNTWHIAVASGTTFYAQYAKTGYITTMDTASFTTRGTTTQFLPEFLKSQGDGLPYVLKVQVFDEFGSLINGVTVRIASGTTTYVRDVNNVGTWTTGIPTQFGTGTVYIPMDPATNTGRILTFEIEKSGYIKGSPTTVLTPGTLNSGIQTVATITIWTVRGIYVNPGSGTVSTIVTVTGEKFGPTEAICIDFGTTRTIAQTTSGPNGTFSVTFTIDTQAYGSHTILATGLATALTATTSFFIKSSITPVSPNVGNVGDWVTITGTGYGANEEIKVIFSTTGTLTTTTNTSPGGSFTITFTIPLEPYDSKTITVKGINKSFQSNTTEFKITGNITLISPDSGIVGSTITVFGNGYSSTEYIWVYLGTNGTPRNNLQCDDKGSFSITFVVDVQPYGTTTVKIQGQSGN